MSFILTKPCGFKQCDFLGYYWGVEKLQEPDFPNSGFLDLVRVFIAVSL
jgi:hypothetical protein